MTTYYFRLMGADGDRISVEAADLPEARNAAVRYLGEYLSQHPGFAGEGHWQLNVENSSGQSLVHVIIATIIPRGAPADIASET